MDKYLYELLTITLNIFIPAAHKVEGYNNFVPTGNMCK